MKSINWKLLFLLSLFGLVMAVATVFWISPNLEPVFWFVIFPVSAFIITKKENEKPFLHGFLLGLTNCIWISLAHIIFVDAYLMSHPQEAVLMISASYSPTLVMLSFDLVAGIVSGIIYGLFAIVLKRVLRKAELNKKRREEANNK
jgi:hypothetical protein